MDLLNNRKPKPRPPPAKDVPRPPDGYVGTLAAASEMLTQPAAFGYTPATPPEPRKRKASPVRFGDSNEEWRNNGLRFINRYFISELGVKKRKMRERTGKEFDDHVIACLDAIQGVFECQESEPDELLQAQMLSTSFFELVDNLRWSP